MMMMMMPRSPPPPPPLKSEALIAGWREREALSLSSLEQCRMVKYWVATAEKTQSQSPAYHHCIKTKHLITDSSGNASEIFCSHL